MHSYDININTDKTLASQSLFFCIYHCCSKIMSLDRDNNKDLGTYGTQLEPLEEDKANSKMLHNYLPFDTLQLLCLERNDPRHLL